MRALARRGRRRIALLAPPDSQNYAQNMIEGATAEAAERGVAFSIVPGADAHQDNPVIERAMGPLFATDAPPDGLIAPTIGGCVTMITAVEAMGLTLGRDFDTVAKEAITFLRRFRKEILVVDEDIDLAGDFLARALLHRIGTPDAAPMQQLVGPDMDMTF